MKRTIKPVQMVRFLGTLSFVLLSFGASFASEDVHAGHGQEGNEEHHEHLVDVAEFENEFIVDHVLDAHDWHLFDLPAGDDKFKPVSIPLPIILVDGGFKFFMSSAFHHGHAVAHHGEDHYFIHQHTIYSTDDQERVTLCVPRIIPGKQSLSAAMAGALPTFLSIKPKDSVAYDTIQTTFSAMHEHWVDGAYILNAKPWDLSITKNVLGILIVFFFMIWLFPKVGRFYTKNGSDVAPKGVASWIEPLVVFVRDDIGVPIIGEKKHGKFMPYLLTVFFFIWIANLVGLLPFGFNITGNIAVTMVLALFTMIIVAINGNKNYWGHIFWMPGVPVPMKIFLAPIEVIGMFAKPFALMVRLFANITAGHIVIMSLIGIMFMMKSVAWSPLSVVMTLFISVLELLVAALQAYVFTILSALFISMAVEEAHH